MNRHVVRKGSPLATDRLLNLFAPSVKRSYNHERSVEHKLQRIRPPCEQETAR
jgi:hypothetical protein